MLLSSFKRRSRLFSSLLILLIVVIFVTGVLVLTSLHDGSSSEVEEPIFSWENFNSTPIPIDEEEARHLKRRDIFCPWKPPRQNIIIQRVSDPLVDPHISDAWYHGFKDRVLPRAPAAEYDTPVVLVWGVNDGTVPYSYLTASADPPGSCVITGDLAPQCSRLVCDVPCSVAPGMTPRGDALVMSPDGWVPDSFRFPGYKIVYDTEPPWYNKDLMLSRSFVRQFDLVAGRSRKYDVWLPPHNEKFFAWPPNSIDPVYRDYSAMFCSPRRKVSKNILASVFMGTLRPHGVKQRLEMVTELERYIGVDKFGASFKRDGCDGLSELEKHETRKGRPDIPGYESKMYRCKFQIMSRYKFYLAYENDVFPDWVTEKVYQGLIAGSVPVYYGAPNIDEYVPPHSVIRMDKFPDTKSLANYLQYLSKNDTAYQEYLAWKQPPYTMRVTDVLAASKLNEWCAICRAVKRLQLAHTPYKRH